MHPAVTYTTSYVPALPNTGFEPTSPFMLAIAAFLIVAAGVFVFPYVRKTLASIFK